jgi:hypothetical protein
MLTEESVIDQITVTENNIIQIRVANRIYRDDELISQTYHRDVLNPGDSLEGQNPKVVAIANAVWDL